MSTEKKTVESQGGSIFRPNNIQIENLSNAVLIALVKMDPNARFYEEIQVGVNANPLGGGVNGGVKQALKQTAPIQKVTLRTGQAAHDIDIDGNKAYVSIYKLDISGNHYLGVIEDRLVKKGKILHIKQTHIDDLTSPHLRPVQYDLIFNKITSLASSNTSTSSSTSASSTTSTASTTPTSTSSPTPSTTSTNSTANP